MLREYRVVMSDTINGERFTFAMRYKAMNMRLAGDQAIKEFGGPATNMYIVSTSQV